MANSVEQLSFELTASALSEQERALTSLRSCAGTVLGAASIAGSFLRAIAGAAGLNAWSILATASFALCSATAVWVLLPHELTLTFGGDELLADGDLRGHHELSGAYRAASSWIKPRLKVTRRKLGRLADCLTVSCILLAIEIVLQTISITA